MSLTKLLLPGTATTGRPHCGYFVPALKSQYCHLQYIESSIWRRSIGATRGEMSRLLACCVDAHGLSARFWLQVDHHACSSRILADQGLYSCTTSRSALPRQGNGSSVSYAINSTHSKCVDSTCRYPRLPRQPQGTDHCCAPPTVGCRSCQLTCTSGPD